MGEFTSENYDPLPTSVHAIRILNLLPGTPDQPDIVCELLNFDERALDTIHLEWNGRYEALSWCWGTGPKTSHVHIQKSGCMYTKLVSGNLSQALRALRLPQKNRYLWIDALCIDQDSIEEKNHQVGMMNEIYANAENVCVWLGNETESSEIAFQFIRKEVLHNSIESLCQGPGVVRKWGAVLNVMQRPWFSRRWVIQEITLARTATIYCGTSTISWPEFAIAVALYLEIETTYSQPLGNPWEVGQDGDYSSLWSENASRMGAGQLVQAAGQLFRGYEESAAVQMTSTKTCNGDALEELDTTSALTMPLVKGHTKSGLPRRSFALNDHNRNPLASLEALVALFWSFSTSEPKDSIYALLSLARDFSPFLQVDPTQSKRKHSFTTGALEVLLERKQYKVDYGLSYAEVCKDFIKTCLSRAAYTSRANSALDILCRPWAIEDKSLPSWIPQLSGAPFASSYGTNAYYRGIQRINADFLVGMPGTNPYRAGGTKLVDSRSLQFRNRVELDHFGMWVRGFVLDEIAQVQPYSQNGEIPFGWASHGGWGNITDNPPDDFWRTLVANRDQHQENPPAYWSTICKQAFQEASSSTGIVNTSDVVKYGPNSLLSQFCRRVQCVIWNRALIRTKNRRLGLVRREVKLGDLVCILYGCGVPVILRRHPTKTEKEVQQETDWDLKYLACYIAKEYKDHLQWRKDLKARKLDQIKKVAEWESHKFKEWRQDVEWHRRWSKSNQMSTHCPKIDFGNLDHLNGTIQDYRNHLISIFWEAHRRMSRSFGAWKEEKRELAKKAGNQGYKPPFVDWRIFDLEIKYARHWRNWVRKRRPYHIQRIVGSVENGSMTAQEAASLLEQKFSHWSQPYSAFGTIFPSRRKVVEGMVLSAAEKVAFEKEIRLNYRSNAPRHDYRFLGECYIHGMMDGEAITYQNQVGVPSELFDLR